MPPTAPALCAGLLATCVAAAVAIVPAAAGADAPPPAGGMAYGADPAVSPTGPMGTGRLSSRRNALLGRTVRVRGVVPGASTGSPVRVERLGADGTWEPAARATAGPSGQFVAAWRAQHIGRFTLRAVLDEPAREGTASVASATATRRITIFKPVRATWFGPGFYGRRTACGQRMSHALEGVAHRSLPCGTLVDLYYRGHTLTVPVVDRGPFRNGADWDLTAAAARELGFDHTDRIGAVRVRG